MKIPRHIGIIMDGNRRWARQHKVPLYKGHEAGVDRLESTVAHAAEEGIEMLTFWAFSTENWNRSKLEVSLLLQIFRTILAGPMIQRLLDKGVRIRVIGDLSRFPKDIQEKIDDVVAKSKDNRKITVNLALSYGGREEILRAVNAILERGDKKIDEETFSSYLYTAGQPDPDLIIRTGGEQRLSGFLPWQAVYSELYFIQTYWPDFDEKEFDKALEEYAARERRFGK